MDEIDYNINPLYFKVWDPNHNEMFEPPHRFKLNSEGVIVPEACSPDPSLISLFLTGLCDTEENPVYVADIVLTRFDTIGVIEWSGENGAGYGSPAKFWIREGEDDYRNINTVQRVLGNIFENSDLLDEHT